MCRRPSFHLAVPALLAWAVWAACTASSPFSAAITVRNPSVRTFEGSGGALGVGLEIRVAGVQNGEPLVVDQGCAGRLCGEPAVTDPGSCGELARRLEPATNVVINWDGRYFPRTADAFGPCLGAARAVTADQAILTLCGRLLAADVVHAPLLCEDHVLALPGTPQAVQLDVPGVAGVPLAPPPHGG